VVPVYVPHNQENIVLSEADIFRVARTLAPLAAEAGQAPYRRGNHRPKINKKKTQADFLSCNCAGVISKAEVADKRVCNCATCPAFILN
jgi:hypothetical protein